MRSWFLSGISKQIGLALLLSPLVAFVGCGEGTGGRVPVAGVINFNGAPLNRGSIELRPVDASGNLTGGMIKDGLFSIGAEQGPMPGKYKVCIFAGEDKSKIQPGDAPGDSAKEPLAKERIPAKYNSKSQLSVDVGPKGEKSLSFDLTSK